MSANDIVNINVSRTLAPAPSTLQRTGAIVSQGGTTLADGARSLITAPADLTPLLSPAAALTSLSWLSGVVTATTTTPHGLPNGEEIAITIAGAVPATYNGTYVATVTGASTFTYDVVANPGTETTPGTYRLGAASYLVNAVAQFFAQGENVPVYILELGAGDAQAGIAALTDWITADPGVFYSYLIPENWDVDDHEDMRELAALHSADTAKTYFFIPTTLDNYADYSTNPVKSAITFLQADDAPAVEVSPAAMFWRTLSYNPSNTNKVPPTAYAFLIAVTPYNPTGAQKSAFRAGFVNFVGTGSEGGISNTILFWGTTADGRDFSYWYAVDWIQINLQLDLANAVINGSNDSTNPLYYDQDGINRLKAKAQQTLNRGLAFGMINNSQPPLVNAVDFITYTEDNPSDYAIGVYNGLSASVVPARGFKSITFNLNVTDFISAA